MGGTSRSSRTNFKFTISNHQSPISHCAQPSAAIPPLVDIQNLRLVEPADGALAGALTCDILIAGGGLGGCAAALAACARGRRVVMSEETDWIGGQLTAQGIAAPDEHRYIEQFGGTRRYYE